MSEPVFHSQDANNPQPISSEPSGNTEEILHDKRENLELPANEEDSIFQPRSIDEVDTNDLGTQSVHIYTADIKMHQEEMSIPTNETLITEEQSDIQENNLETPPPLDIDNMGPGEQLAYYRVQKRLSKQHVADKLYLSLHVVKLLEADDYSQLPPPIFVRGYIRNYSKILEISAEPLVEAYERRASKKYSPTNIRPQVKKEDETSSGDSWFKILTSVILMVALVLMALWQIYPPDSTFITPEEDNPEETVIAIHSIPIETNGSEGNENTYTPPSEDNGETENTSDNPDNGNTSTETQTTPVENANTAQQETVNSNTFSLSLTRDTWMRINDASGKALFNGIGKAGKQVSIEGKPPFNLKVGHAQGVTLEYKGTAVPLKDHPNRRGLTFTVGN